MQSQPNSQRSNEYVTPRLRRFGRVVDLTASGTTGNPESGTGDPKRKI